MLWMLLHMRIFEVLVILLRIKPLFFCELGIKLFSISSVNIFICSKNGNNCKNKCGSYTYRMCILKSLILRNNARESPVHTCHLVQVPPRDVKCLSVNQAASLHPLSYNPNPLWFVLHGCADLLLARKVSASFLVLFWTWSAILQAWAAHVAPSASSCI